MTVNSTGRKRTAGAGILVFAGALAFAQTDQTATAPRKPTAQHSTSQAASSKKSAPAGTAHAKSRTTPSGGSSHKGKKKSKRAARRGQEKIDSERTRQIQEALIRQHYMSGEATGTWDARTEEDLRRYQAENGWQSKTVPDSRALIKLGLGPNHDHLLNPESAMTTASDPHP